MFLVLVFLVWGFLGFLGFFKFFGVLLWDLFDLGFFILSFVFCFLSSFSFL